MATCTLLAMANSCTPCGSERGVEAQQKLAWNDAKSTLDHPQWFYISEKWACCRVLLVGTVLLVLACMAQGRIEATRSCLRKSLAPRVLSASVDFGLWWWSYAWLQVAIVRVHRVVLWLTMLLSLLKHCCWCLDAVDCFFPGGLGKACHHARAAALAVTEVLKVISEFQSLFVWRLCFEVGLWEVGWQ